MVFRIAHLCLFPYVSVAKSYTLTWFSAIEIGHEMLLAEDVGGGTNDSMSASRRFCTAACFVVTGGCR